MNDQVKIFFELVQDEDGYPPATAESVWATTTGHPDEFELDNVPFFARDATLGDVVTARKVDGVLWFDTIVRPSKNSLIRLIFLDATALDEVNKVLCDMGCATEGASQYRLLAVSIPPSTRLEWVQGYLAKQEASGVIGYEEPILRHP